MSPQLKIYHKRKENNICVGCGKCPPEEPGIRCKECKIKRNKISKKQKEKRPEGICRQCLVRPVVIGLVSCAKCRQYGAEKSLKRHRKIRETILTLYGNCCCCCGISNLKYLQLDHKNNDGNLERASLPPTLRGGRFYQHILKQGKRDDLQLLCANCHNAKRYGGCTLEDHPKFNQ